MLTSSLLPPPSQGNYSDLLVLLSACFSQLRGDQLAGKQESSAQVRHHAQACANHPGVVNNKLALAFANSGVHEHGDLGPPCIPPPYSQWTHEIFTRTPFMGSKVAWATGVAELAANSMPAFYDDPWKLSRISG